MNEGQEPSVIIAYRPYLAACAVLIVLLACTIAVARLNLLAQYSVVAALLIASVKAGVVLMRFMHLGSEGKLIKMMLLLAVVALTTIISLTFVDILYR